MLFPIFILVHEFVICILSTSIFLIAYMRSDLYSLLVLLSYRCLNFKSAFYRKKSMKRILLILSTGLGSNRVHGENKQASLGTSLAVSPPPNDAPKGYCACQIENHGQPRP
jgi:hypothetical protein